MTALGSVVIQTVVLLTGLVVVQGDTPVGCVFGGSCELPCRFQPSSDTILHWNKINGKNVQVHSYYDDQDQLGYQDPLYKGRTSLFHDQISGGNASLRLSRVNLTDQGRYLCYASTLKNNKESFVILTARAPDPTAVASVEIGLVNNTVTCKSGGIYPIPQLTWSVSPRPATVLKNTTEVHIDDKGLYNISGSLRTMNDDTQSNYCCSVHNEHSARKATMRLYPPMQSAPGSEVLLPCDASGLDDITWTFNHNQTILRRQAGQEKVVETEWQQHVRDLSESGSLLLNVTSSAQSEGTYRCTLRYAGEEDITHIELKIIELKIPEDPIAGGLGVLLAAILGIVISIIIIWRKKVKPKKKTKKLPAGQETSSTTSSLLAPSNETQPEGLETSNPPAPSSETQPEGLETSIPPAPSNETQPEGLETSIPPAPSSETQPEGLETSSPPTLQ